MVNQRAALDIQRIWHGAQARQGARARRAALTLPLAGAFVEWGEQLLVLELEGRRMVVGEAMAERWELENQRDVVLVRWQQTERRRPVEQPLDEGQPLDEDPPLDEELPLDDDRPVDGDRPVDDDRAADKEQWLEEAGVDEETSGSQGDGEAEVGGAWPADSADESTAGNPQDADWEQAWAAALRLQRLWRGVRCRLWTDAHYEELYLQGSQRRGRRELERRAQGEWRDLMAAAARRSRPADGPPSPGPGCLEVAGFGAPTRLAAADQVLPASRQSHALCSKGVPLPTGPPLPGLPSSWGAPRALALIPLTSTKRERPLSADTLHPFEVQGMDAAGMYGYLQHLVFMGSRAVCAPAPPHFGPLPPLTPFP